MIKVQVSERQSVKHWVGTSGVGQILPAVLGLAEAHLPWNGKSLTALQLVRLSCAARRFSFYRRGLGCVTAAHQSSFYWGTNGREIHCVNIPTASPLQEFLTTPTQRRYRSGSAARPISTLSSSPSSSSSSSLHLWGAWIKPWAVKHWHQWAKCFLFTARLKEEEGEQWEIRPNLAENPDPNINTMRYTDSWYYTKLYLHSIFLYSVHKRKIKTRVEKKPV